MAVSSARGVLPSDQGGMAIRGGAIRVVGYVSGILVSLGTATILVRHLGISGFGRYVTVMSLIGLVGGVTEAGIFLFGIREFGARTDQDRRYLMANLLGIRLTLTLAGIACAAGFALAVGYRQVLVLGAVVAGSGLLVQVIADVLSIPLQSRLRLGSVAVVDLSRRLIALGLIATLALLGAGLLPLLAVSTVSWLVALALLGWMVRTSITIRVSFDWRLWRELFRESLPYAVAVSITAIYFYVTIIVMSLTATASQTGFFATSFRVTQVALGIPPLLLTAIFPLMSRERTDQEQNRGDMVGKVFTVAVICGVWMSLAIGVGASFIVDVVAGPQGHGAISVLRIQSIVLTMSFVSTASAVGLISLRRFRPIIVASSFALAFNILLVLLLVPSIGARGGALADVLTEALVAIGLTAVLMHHVPQHKIRASVAPPVVLAATLSAGVIFLPVSPVVRVIGASTIYFGALLLMGAIPDEVINAVRRFRL